MRRKISLYVKDILQNMDDAAEFIREITYGQFFTDKRTQYAVLRAVEIIGEAAKNVPEEIRARYRDVPWKEMAGMRDKVVHSYFGIDTEIVWLAVKDRIPSIRPTIVRVLHDLEIQGL